ncbi:hypothetical protein chiPu_0026950, partial [Chiloscyllium punctatum]|nr:hypothetical protein [Chiloscyllium punctatum]
MRHRVAYGETQGSAASSVRQPSVYGTAHAHLDGRRYVTRAAQAHATRRPPLRREAPYVGPRRRTGFASPTVRLRRTVPTATRLGSAVECACAVAAGRRQLTTYPPRSVRRRVPSGHSSLVQHPGTSPLLS